MPCCLNSTAVCSDGSKAPWWTRSSSRSICPVTSQGAACPRAQAISVRNGHGIRADHLRTGGCTSTVESSLQKKKKWAFPLVCFFMFHFVLSVLSLLWKTRRQKLYSCPLLDLQSRSCYSLYRSVPGAALQTRPLYFFVDFLNHPFIPNPCHLPPLCAQTRCTEDAPSPGIILIR